MENVQYIYITDSQDYVVSQDIDLADGILLCVLYPFLSPIKILVSKCDILLRNVFYKWILNKILCNNGLYILVRLLINLLFI